MAINRRFLSGLLLSLTIATVGVASVGEAEAKGFDDIYYNKLELLKAKKLKKHKHHHLGSKHHLDDKFYEKKALKRFKKHRSHRRRHFKRSSFGHKFFFKHH